MQAATELERNPFVSCLHHLFSAKVCWWSLQTQDSDSGLSAAVANARNILRLPHYSPDSIMQAATEIIVRELERNSSVSCLHHLFFSGFCWSAAWGSGFRLRSLCEFPEYSHQWWHFKRHFVLKCLDGCRILRRRYVLAIGLFCIVTRGLLWERVNTLYTWTHI